MKNADNTILLEEVDSSDQRNVPVRKSQRAERATENSIKNLKLNMSKPLKHRFVLSDIDDQQIIPCNRSSDSKSITRFSFTSRGSALGYMKTPQRDDTGREDKGWSSDDQAMFSKVI